MSQNKYLRRKPKRKKLPVRSAIQSSVEKRGRLWTLMSARYLGIIGDEDRKTNGKYIVADYPVPTVLSVHDTDKQANEAARLPRREGEWK